MRKQQPITCYPRDSTQVRIARSSRISDRHLSYCNASLKVDKQNNHNHNNNNNNKPKQTNKKNRHHSPESDNMNYLTGNIFSLLNTLFAIQPVLFTFTYFLT